MKGYKVFDKDFKCCDFQYEIGKTYEMPEEDVEICGSGFHFFKKLTDCFEYYSLDGANKVAEIEAGGKILHDGNKSCCSMISIVRELSWHDVLDMVNTGKCNTGRNNSGSWNSGNYNSGNWNSGDGNSGNYNSGIMNRGHYNSGYYNSGNWNSGHWNSGKHNIGDGNSGRCNSGNRNSGSYNSGNYNSGDSNSGFFNTDTPFIRMFNRPTNIKDRKNITFPYFFVNVLVTDFVLSSIMTDEEKKKHPDHETVGGYLKEIDYKEAWINAFNQAKSMEDWEDEKKRLLALPNFDYDIFEEITGITKEMIDEDNNTK